MHEINMNITDEITYQHLKLITDIVTVYCVEGRLQLYTFPAMFY